MRDRVTGEIVGNTKPNLRTEASAINCTAKTQSPTSMFEVLSLLVSAVSDATRRAYRSDLHHFRKFGGEIPASPELVAAYIASSMSHFAPATIIRRIASLSKAHKTIGAENPAQSELVKQALRGMKRIKGMNQREAKPLLKEDLFEILDASGNRLKDIRDRALLLIGFAGGFRRSELVALNVEDVEHVRQGIIITIRRSKTDQEGKGRTIGIPFGRGRWCPVKALEEWQLASKVTEGAIFYVINKHSQIADKRLSGEAVSLLIKARISKLGRDPVLYSGHSLRAGFVTSAAIAGASSYAIRQQTGHASDGMVSRYVRQADMFVANAAGQVL